MHTCAGAGLVRPGRDRRPEEYTERGALQDRVACVLVLERPASGRPPEVHVPALGAEFDKHDRASLPRSRAMALSSHAWRQDDSAAEHAHRNTHSGGRRQAARSDGGGGGGGEHNHTVCKEEVTPSQSSPTTAIAIAVGQISTNL